MTHSLRLLLGLATAALLVAAAGCIADVQPADEADEATLAGEGVHVDSEPILSTSAPGGGSAVGPNPSPIAPGAQPPPEPEPSPWMQTPTNPVAGPNLVQPEPSPWRPHTPGGAPTATLSSGPPQPSN